MPQYTAVAVVLHWAIAAAIIGNFALGWWMHEAVDAPDTQALAINAFQVHKSLGLTILALSLLRLGWRLLHRPPPLPEDMPGREKIASRITHWTFYALMILIPFSGWLYVSTQWRDGMPLNVPTLWFGLFEVPHLFGLNEIAAQTRQRLSGTTGEIHELLAMGLMLLLVLHVAAALKHHFINRDGVLARMLPFLSAPAAQGSAEPMNLARRIILIGGLVAIVIAAAAIAGNLLLSSTAGLTTGLPATGITSAPDSEWLIDPDRSAIRFSGIHAGRPFNGRFTRWQGNIRLDPTAPAQSMLQVVVDTASARDGVPLHDKSLPKAEWFDVANHPTSTAQATAVRPREDGSYDLHGVLRIKGNELVLPPFTMQIEDNRLRITGEAQVDRAAADLGMESDPNARWVSKTISVQVRIEAARKE